MVGPIPDDGDTLGQMLRARREARGLSREQAAQQARVQLVFVRALEDDDYHLLPDELYLVRFVFEYSTFLGLDAAAAHAAFRRQLRRPPGPGPLYRAVPRLAALPWRRLLGAAAVLLATIPVAFILLSLAGREREAPTPTRVPGTPARAGGESAPGAPVPLSGGPVPASEPAGSGAPPASQSAQGAGPANRQRHLLVARAHELTWLAVQADGGTKHGVLLREGEMARWEAEREFLLTVGNAGGVEFTLDGQPVPMRARRGEVIRGLRLPPPSAPPPGPGAPAH